MTWKAAMNILLIGSGGREHALAWKLKASPLLTRLYAAPGNPGIAEEAECVPLDIADHAAVADFCRVKTIDLVVVGREAPPGSKAPRVSRKICARDMASRPGATAASPSLRRPMTICARTVRRLSS